MVNSADELLELVHKRIGLGVEILTFSESGDVEVRWRRDYDGDWSEERLVSAKSLVLALEMVLAYEDEADAEESVAALEDV